MSTPGGGMRTVVASSAVLSVALLGDALLYAVLPVHAESFGISLAWVGILLSANRVVRVFAYGLIARLTQRVGLRRTCIIAAIGAVVSTLSYGIGEGHGWLLAGRVLWGLSYAALVLATLAYAVEQRGRAGTRIGVSRAVQRIGPILALVGGAWLTGVIGPREIFIVLAVLTALALPFAWSLPRDVAAGGMDRTPSLGWPRPVDGLFFVQGLGVDGVFALSITLILAREQSISAAVLGGGALLAMRHVGEAVAAPVFGVIADRMGATRVFVFAAVMTAFGFAGIAAGFAVVGALVMLVFRGALAALGPAAIVQGLSADEQVVAPLARMQAWRDLGAAIGPVGTGVALAATTPEMLHGLMAVLTVAALVLWIRDARRGGSPR